MLLRNDVISFLVHNCSSKCTVEESVGKSESFFLAKTENLFEVIKCFA